MSRDWIQLSVKTWVEVAGDSRQPIPPHTVVECQRARPQDTEKAETWPLVSRIHCLWQGAQAPKQIRILHCVHCGSKSMNTASEQRGQRVDGFLPSWSPEEGFLSEEGT